MADDIQELALIDPSNDPRSPLLQGIGMSSLPSMSSYSPAKQEDDDDYLGLLPEDSQPSSSSRSNFRSKKRNRVMQSCVACHSQKRKCDRKRPCTRCTEHGIAGQCVYQLEDPAVRDGPEQDELYRLRSRVRELERTVRVLMQKPLSRRAAAALEAETDAILGTTSTRKRKVDKDKDGDDRATKMLKLNTHTSDRNTFPEWVMPDASFPSPIDSPFSPYAPTPSESHYSHHHYFQYAGDFTPPGDVPTPPYSTFPTPSSDAGSPFKVPEPPARRFSDGTSLANMLSHATMAATPESLAAGSPSAASVVSFAPIAGVAPPNECGCGVNPIGNEVLASLSQQLEAAHGVISTLPDHQVGGACVTVLGIASLIDAIAVATRSNSSTAMSAPPTHQGPPPGPMPMTAPAVGPPPPPPSTTSFMGSAPSTHMTPASTSHMSPLSHMSPSVSEPGPSPHSTIATPPNYGLYSVSHSSQPFYHADVPTVVGFNSLSSWASFSGNPSFLNNNASTSSLSNFDGHKDSYSHPHPHRHHTYPNGNIVVHDQGHP